MFQAVVAALFMNIYIVGLNQLSDVEIDKVLNLLLEINNLDHSQITFLCLLAF